MGTNAIIAGMSFVVLGLLGFTEPGRRGWTALQQHLGATTLLILAVLATMLGGMRGPETASLADDPVRLLRMGLLGLLLLLSIARIAQSSRSWQYAGAGLRFMLAYGLFALLSATWSVGPLMSAYKASEVIVLVLTAIAVAGDIRTRQDLDWLLNVFMMILLYLVITILVGMVLAPEIAFRAASRENPEAATWVVGVLGFINPASVGGFGALVLVLAAGPLLNPRERSGRIGWWLLFAMGATVLLLARSRTSLLGALVGLVIMLIAARRAGLALALAGLGALLALLTALGDTISSYVLRGQSEELFLNLSGRVYYWGLVWEKFVEAPLWGHGFYAIRSLFYASSADNTYLQVLLELGVVGLVLLSVPVLYLGWSLLRLRPRGRTLGPDDWLWIRVTGVAAVIIVRSISGTSFHILHNMLMFFLVVLLATAALKRQAALRSAARARRGERAVSDGGDDESDRPDKPAISPQRPAAAAATGR